MAQDYNSLDESTQRWLDDVAAFFMEVRRVINEDTKDEEMIELMYHFEDIRSKITNKIASSHIDTPE